MSPNQRPGWQRIAVIVISLLLFVAFLGAGGSKLAGVEMHVKSFERWGYPRWFLTVTGLVEVLAALLVVVPKTRFYGGVLLVCTMAGAALTHLRFAEYGDLFAPLFLFVLSALVTWASCPCYARG